MWEERRRVVIRSVLEAHLRVMFLSSQQGSRKVSVIKKEVGGEDQDAQLNASSMGNSRSVVMPWGYSSIALPYTRTHSLAQLRINGKTSSLI